MKMYSTQLKLLLAASLMIQMGCNGNDRRNGQLYNQYGYGAYGAPQGGFQQPGNAFRQQSPMLGTLASNLANNGNVTSIIDADGDGVTNSLDRCPNTPRGATVDASGCSSGAASDGKSSKDGVTKKDEGNQGNEETFTVDIPREPKWKKDCKDALPGEELSRRDADTDGDGIYDKCEIALKTQESYIGLDEKVFNGAIIAAKRFYSEGDGLLNNKKADSSLSSILLTSDENKVWKKSKALGGLSDGAASKFDRQVTKKFLALTYNSNDVAALSKLMQITQPDSQGAPTGTSAVVSGQQGQNQSVIINEAAGDKAASDASKQAKFKAFFDIQNDNLIRVRGQKIPDLFQALQDKLQYGLIRNDYFEMIPFKISEVNGSVAYLSGINSSTTPLMQGDQFVYVAETNLVIPEELNGGIDLRVGYLTSDKTKARAGSKAGMFFVIHDNNTDILTTDLITSNLSGGLLEKTRGTIAAPSNCITTHLVIAYLAESNKVSEGIKKAMFSENVFYRDSVDGWKPIPQEWMRIQPMDISADQKCSMTSDQVVFQDAASYLTKATLPATNLTAK